MRGGSNPCGLLEDSDRKVFCMEDAQVEQAEDLQLLEAMDILIGDVDSGSAMNT